MKIYKRICQEFLECFFLKCGVSQMLYLKLSVTHQIYRSIISLSDFLFYLQNDESLSAYALSVSAFPCFR